MRKFGLIGYPLGHSFSKKYFSEKFLNENIDDCSYENYPIPDISQLKDLLSVESELCGLNVTIPYKTDVIRFLSYIDPEAEEIGAVNVLKIEHFGKELKISGFNSDIDGIRATLEQYLNGKVKNAIVLGTGGGSKAVCHVLKKAGIKISIVSRSRKQGILDYSDVDRDLVKKSGLIINTTPLGMFPNIEFKPELDYNLLNSEHILFDLVYNPEVTSFLSEGLKRGCTAISGLKMLHSQADKSWEIWNNNNL
jgi:shikimate dehydrogenase